MKNQTDFCGKLAKFSAEQRALLKAHNEAKNGLKLTKKGGDYSSTPLFKKDAQYNLF